MPDPTRIDLSVDPTSRRMQGVTVHGNVPFDVPFISHIEGNLYVGGCTNGLVLPEHIQHVVSLYPWEAYTVNHELKSGLAVRLYDGEVDPVLTPGLGVWAIACNVDAPTLIHCQAGLNRSALIAALVLMSNGNSVSKAIDLLREKRSPAVLCNANFERWLHQV